MNIFVEYIFWHYIVAPREIFVILNNYIKGMWHKFMIPRHLSTLFYPWMRTEPSQVGAKPANIGERIMYWIMDIYIRLLAAVVRMAIIIAGVIAQGLIIIGFLSFFVLWLIWPFLVLGLIFFKAIPLILN